MSLTSPHDSRVVIVGNSTSGVGLTETEPKRHVRRPLHGAGDGRVARAAATVPIGRLGRAGEVADTVVLLHSDRSGVVTGSAADRDRNIQGCHD